MAADELKCSEANDCVHVFSLKVAGQDDSLHCHGIRLLELEGLVGGSTNRVMHCRDCVELSCDSCLVLHPGATLPLERRPMQGQT
jgi:hypothetical protein